MGVTKTGAHEGGRHVFVLCAILSCTHVTSKRLIHSLYDHIYLNKLKGKNYPQVKAFISSIIEGRVRVSFVNKIRLSGMFFNCS